jgi:uncharacterized protein YceH (UPF0502 family)
MDVTLTPVEARVLGCLLEKESTTPAYYPLSLSALTNACNQRSNRSPVMQMEEPAVKHALDTLLRKQLVWHKKSSDSRVMKYAHRIESIEKFSPAERAVICVLLLRGPQTPGELRGRTGRMWKFEGPPDVEKTLETLAAYENGPYTARLPREAGRRERRYAHLLCGPVEVDREADAVTLKEAGTASTSHSSASRPPGENDRLDRLEADVRKLQKDMEDLRRRLGE